MLSDNPTREELREFFKNDQFATGAGCYVIEGKKGYAVCGLDLSEKHNNAQGYPMGGAIFTLADFCLAVACNVGQPPTVSIDNNIRYFDRARGTKLIATCTADRLGRHAAFFTVDIKDELGTHVATMTATCYRVS
ncbi:MAG: PaaI family thioesterase [Eggerthellaceae bacterium]|jgi:acyl-CoA thioesterase